MEPVIALLVVTSAVLLVNRLWLHRPRGLEVALRSGVAAMFALTGVAHFVGMRDDLVDMVPTWVPLPEVVVTVTGVLELVAAAAMIHRTLSVLASAGLTLLLLAMYPANVALALSDVPLPWWDELIPRTLMQLLFLAATATIFVLTRRAPVRVRARATPMRTTPPPPAGGRSTAAPQ